MKGAMLMVFVL